MKHLKEVVVVEGRYDRIKLQSVVDATVIATNGFRIFSNRDLCLLLRKLAQERGLVILTDSDRGGFRIRGYLRGVVPPQQVKHAYVPELRGKEPRKAKPGREGILGVEGIAPEVILEALRRAGCTFYEEELHKTVCFTRQQLYEDGLFGRADSAIYRKKVLKALSLPEKMTVSTLLGALNAGFTQEEYDAARRTVDEN